MTKASVFVVLAGALAVPLAARAASPAPPVAPSPVAAPSPGAPAGSERTFVKQAVAALSKRYATTAAAVAGGYLRYTDEDGTGAISYANRKWTSADAAHPSQLWYDARGRLIGADYSVPLTDAPPHAFGLQPGRFQKFTAHVHYGLAGPNGTTIYGGAGAKTMAKGGGTVDDPTAEALVKAGLAKSPADVKFVFTFPAIWDAAIWLIPNPDGAFAEKNPNVKPVHAKESM